MRNASVFSTVFLLSLSLILVRCTPDASSIPSTEEILIKNTWAVDYYFNHQDMTSEFGNSSLLFSSTGAVAYQKNGEIVAGTWSKTVDASNNEVLAIHFNTTDIAISRLNETWKVSDRSFNALQLEDNGTTTIQFRIRTQ